MLEPEIKEILDYLSCECADEERVLRPIHDKLWEYFIKDYDQEEDKELILNDNDYLLVNILDKFRLIEHGGNVAHGWITPHGREVVFAIGKYIN